MQITRYFTAGQLVSPHQYRNFLVWFPTVQPTFLAAFHFFHSYLFTLPLTPLQVVPGLSDRRLVRVVSATFTPLSPRSYVYLLLSILPSLILDLPLSGA